ncbi:MAG: hypothetical protein JST68_17200 [Bacteroidetes bacterium]|nr:hypothetical protein [Bacteroidota bacterium]
MRILTLISFLLLSIPRLVVDSFPITDNLLIPAKGDETSSHEIKSGPLKSTDQVWLTNQSLHQTMIVGLYTDGFRTGFILFDNTNIPKELIAQVELTRDSELASTQQKQKYFAGFLKASKKIDPKYFVSKKGFHLGSPKEDLLKTYGKPDKISTSGTTEILKWDFTGDSIAHPKSSRANKPLAKDSYGYQVTGFIQNGRIIALILHNDIP